MKFVVAVSGGVDSVVLLDMLVDKHGADSLVVAHFDHGVRSESGSDADFVRALAERYGCRLELRQEKLGAGASEALARERRYAFLHEVSEKWGAPLVTAHHLDDLVETVALHLQRGTGWRGLTPFGQSIERPLLLLEKTELLAYAQRRGLQWREDETNASTVYARNRIRPAVAKLPLETKREIAALYARQWELRYELEREVQQLLPEGMQQQRYFFIMSPPAARDELLRVITDGRLTRPQRNRLAHAVAVARPHTRYQAGSGVEIVFTSTQFTVKLLK